MLTDGCILTSCLDLFWCVMVGVLGFGWCCARYFGVLVFSLLGVNCGFWG